MVGIFGIEGRRAGLAVVFSSLEGNNKTFTTFYASLQSNQAAI